MKKYISLAATLAVMGSLILAAPAFAQQAPGGGQGGFGRMNGGQPPAVFGTVASISGTTLTVTGRQGFGPSSSSGTTYTVDASNATVTKNNAASSVASIAVGDTVFVQGTVSGSNITATTIRDGVVPGGPRGAKGGANAFGMGIRGTVSAVSGTTLTVNARQGFGISTPTTSYTVDASNATVTKNNATSTVASIAVGDMVFVQGTISGSNVTATSIRDGMPQAKIQGNGEPVVAGSVTVISGNSITITNKSNVTYTIDASNSKFVVPGVTSPTISNVAVGDNLVIQGTVNGNNVTASSVIDQKGGTSGKNGNSGNQQHPHPGIMGGLGNVFGSIGSFFKHIFGF